MLYPKEHKNVYPSTLPNDKKCRFTRIVQVRMYSNLSQMTYFRLFQTERVYRRQFQLL